MTRSFFDSNTIHIQERKESCPQQECEYSCTLAKLDISLLNYVTFCELLYKIAVVLVSVLILYYYGLCKCH